MLHDRAEQTRRRGPGHRGRRFLASAGRPHITQQFSKAVLEATSPFQFAFSTRAGTESVTHALQALTRTENATVVSIDGVGAFDLISRNTMVSGLMAMEKR